MSDIRTAKSLLNLSISSVFNKCQSENIFERRLGFSFILSDRKESSLDFINRKSKCLNDFKKSVDTNDINISAFEKRLKECINKDYRKRGIENRIAFYLKHKINIIFGIILILLIYLFALNGRYKPIGNSEYGLYKDTWTGKIHSAFMEYGKNPQ